MRTTHGAACGAVALLVHVVPVPLVHGAEPIPSFAELMQHKVELRPELRGVHPRVFVTEQELDALRQRAHTTDKASWDRVLQQLPALASSPPPPPGPQARRAQNNAAYAIAGASLAWKIERKPEYLAAARQWLLAAIDYEPWGYTYNKPNVDLAAGHLLYAIGWSYDLLYNDLTPQERGLVRASLERHARLLYQHFAPGPGKRFVFTQNHDFIPTAGLAVAALALLGETPEAEQWAVLARAHQHRASSMLSPDGYYYEGIEYWIFSTPWMVHFLDAWEHSTGESLWDRELFKNWKNYLAHMILPDGQNAFDFGDAWEGATTRAKGGAEYARIYPGGTLQSNYNVLYRVAARFNDPQAQAVAERMAGFGHSNLEEYWTLLWRNPELKPDPTSSLPLHHHFQDSGVVVYRTSWEKDALAFAFKAGPPQGHRVLGLLPSMPEARLDSGHAHPDAGSFIIWAHGRYLTGDTGYSGTSTSKEHNTLTFNGMGQGVKGSHDVWRGLPDAQQARIGIRNVSFAPGEVKITADIAAAYPTDAKVNRFTRTFTFDGNAAFTVVDQVALSEPRIVAWHMQSDGAFARQEGSFQTGGEMGPGLLVTFCQPAKVNVKPLLTKVKTAGPPGSIETGVEEERGHQVMVSTASPMKEVTFEARLEVRAPGAPPVKRVRAQSQPGKAPACNPARSKPRPVKGSR